jgi:protein-S-isoprenylcysteine O-methyltransferase Ste14
LTDEPRWLGNTLSLFALAVAAAGLAALVWMRRLFATSPILIGVQVAAVMLMLWARMTFGARSFHAAASTSEGGLVTNGPYRFLRHPIYASIIYFVWAGQLQSSTGGSLAAAGVVSAGLVARMLLEERFLRAAYPEYENYARRAKRVIPFVL